MLIFLGYVLLFLVSDLALGIVIGKALAYGQADIQVLEGTR